MELKYNEETGTKAIEEYVIQAIRGLAKVKGDLDIKIKYQPKPKPRVIVKKKKAKPKPPTPKPPEPKVEVIPAPKIEPAPRIDVKLGSELDNLPENMTVKQMMKFLNIGQNKAYSLLSTGEIKCFKIGTRNKRIKKTAFIEWFNRQ